MAPLTFTLIFLAYSQQSQTTVTTSLRLFLFLFLIDSPAEAQNHPTAVIYVQRLSLKTQSRERDSDLFHRSFESHCQVGFKAEQNRSARGESSPGCSPLVPRTCDSPGWECGPCGSLGAEPALPHPGGRLILQASSAFPFPSYSPPPSLQNPQVCEMHSFARGCLFCLIDTYCPRIPSF